MFAAEVPPLCGQLVLVLPDQVSSGCLSLWKKSSSDGDWQPALLSPQSWPVSLGRNGVTTAKREGDGCTPAGCFPLGPAFGKPDAWDWPQSRLPLIFTHPYLVAVDDPGSMYYNEIVDARDVSPDWESTEEMFRDDSLYDLGLVIGYNKVGAPCLGSCIFVHLELDPGHPTAGCIAMSRSNMEHMLAWLNPDFSPHVLIRNENQSQSFHIGST